MSGSGLGLTADERAVLAAASRFDAAAALVARCQRDLETALTVWRSSQTRRPFIPAAPADEVRS